MTAFKLFNLIKYLIHHSQGFSLWHQLLSVADLTKEINPSLAKPPLKFNGGLAKFGLIFLVK